MNQNDLLQVLRQKFKGKWFYSKDIVDKYGHINKLYHKLGQLSRFGYLYYKREWSSRSNNEVDKYKIKEKE